MDSSSSPFPLHFRDAVLERTEIPFNPQFIRNVLPRLNWEALKITATELGLGDLLPVDIPSDDPEWNKENANNLGAPAVSEDVKMDVEVEGGTRETQEEQKDERRENVLRQLHGLLLETGVTEGKLVCGKCAFEYPIKEGVGNFLLPAHLG
jgi:multifunctional methyltransferase subunit TRM112